MGCLYLITSPSGMRYVGIGATTAASRWISHVDAARRNGRTRERGALAIAIRQYGPEAFHVRTLVRAQDWGFLQYLETAAIQAYRTRAPYGYNMTSGGDTVPSLGNQKDNTNLPAKVRLRRSLLKELAPPRVLETHGGVGLVGQYCYGHLPWGCAVEKIPTKAATLARKRPHWAVYQGDSLGLLEAGVVGALGITLVDIDPYGSPWDHIEALLAAKDGLPPVLGLAVNDGMRICLALGTASNVNVLKSAVVRHGNFGVFAEYLAVCRELLEEKAAAVGYVVRHWWGWYTGANSRITHYAAVLARND